MWFFPDSPELIDHPAPQRVERAPDGALVLRVAASPLLTVAPARVSGVLVAEPNSDATGVARDNLGPVTIDAAWSGAAPAPRATGEDSTGSAAMNAADIRAAAGLDAAAGTAAGADLGLLAALGLAFVGGLILNLMPCVFPVVSIKVLGFVQDAGASRARARANGFAFAAGVVVSFWALAGALLALRASGEALGWGWQLQSPPVVAGLAALFFVLGLNLSGVFEMGARVQALAGRAPAGNGLGGAFASGLLATAVATPCTAPLMGAALGWALTQPALAAMAVFTALALGMAAPYVLLASLPALAAKLPRPGRWMETLKQFLAFPLYLTVVWLVWVLAEQMGAGAAARLLAGLVLIAAGLWAWQRFGVAGNARGFALGAAAAFVAAAVFVGWPQGEPQAATRTASKDWGVWSVAQVDALRAQKRAVFVDFTAAWCVSCQVNKRVVLDTDAVRGAFERAGVERLRADWTQRDPAITAALAALGRSGVPVYVVWPADGGAPEVLPEVLTRDLVLGAIARATQGTTPRTDAAALPRDGGDATRAN
jgi:thiol:disulfide interchange protein DsbD